ncbi:hypothetical protein BYT27DRAFT_7263228 [Phlegmacium glaucopus]|nr:hypothetical protein BYT27DRAFT_7263228 [Phlegmacium glaucopus]
MAGSFAFVLPSRHASGLARRAAPDNTVVINGPQNYCMIVPREAHTDVGDSETPGGMTSYCSADAKYSDLQGEFSPDFWRDVDYITGQGLNGGRYVQLTGCINPESLDRINLDDAGGQYDSSGGQDGHGNPAGSVCTGYKHYVELLEPAGSRACIRCCNDPDDCITSNDTDGCPAVIPGNYFDCD